MQRFTPDANKLILFIYLNWAIKNNTSFSQQFVLHKLCLHNLCRNKRKDKQFESVLTRHT